MCTRAAGKSFLKIKYTYYTLLNKHDNHHSQWQHVVIFSSVDTVITTKQQQHKPHEPTTASDDDHHRHIFQPAAENRVTGAVDNDLNIFCYCSKSISPKYIRCIRRPRNPCNNNIIICDRIRNHGLDVRCIFYCATIL